MSETLTAVQIEIDYRTDLLQRCRYEHRVEMQHNNVVAFRDRGRAKFEEVPKPSCDKLEQMFGQR